MKESLNDIVSGVTVRRYGDDNPDFPEKVTYFNKEGAQDTYNSWGPTPEAANDNDKEPEEPQAA